MKLEQMIHRLLSERLEPFNVPIEIRNNLQTEILAVLSRQETGPKGTYVYKPEQSMAADLDLNRNKPKT